jgi:hypothetical protein
MENMIVQTVLGTFVIEDYGDAGYDVATSIADSDCFYHIQKGMTEVEIQSLFKEMKDLED